VWEAAGTDSSDAERIGTVAPDAGPAVAPDHLAVESRTDRPGGTGREPIAPEPESAPQPGSLSLPLFATAALVGEYRWIEYALYVLLGRWVEDVPLPSVQVHLDAQSMRHAWHAELWGDRLPVLSGSDHDRLTVPSRPTAALFRLLGAAIPAGVSRLDDGITAGPEIDVGTPDLPGALPRLAGLYRVVVPRLVVSYGQHLAITSEPTDGPVIRALRLVLNDEMEDWRAGERLVQRLMARPHDVAAVSDYQRRLESALVGAGARSGLVRIPEPAPGR
jgi:hypothetical protein